MKARPLMVWKSSTDPEINLAVYSDVAVAATTITRASRILRIGHKRFGTYWSIADDPESMRIATSEGIWARRRMHGAKLEAVTLEELLARWKIDQPRVQAPAATPGAASGTPRQDEYANYLDLHQKCKHLSKEEREALWNRLPPKQQKTLQKSFENGGWHDVRSIDRVNAAADAIKKESGVDLFNIRIMVLKGRRRVFVKKEFWNSAKAKFSQIKECHLMDIFGGYVAVDAGPDEYELVKTR